ncbi:hypothetical protein WH95_01355 [Kiloniella litopenaei]|uniref:Uncharacterized protein n=1 Tax=Kiloniella litopenaei TaxID=1549748 RepID=A0A0M2RFF7_9PROT|nr:hypothetical protein [Kiloniella litopenaei]KKJ78750.1 hypothetical protein WH95_01355 [Kiloniella litopenaei]
MKPNLAERFLLDECNPETKRILETEIDEMISGRGPRFREHHFNLYDIKLDAVRRKVGIVDIFDPKESGRIELEMFHFRLLLKRLTSQSAPDNYGKGDNYGKTGSGVLNFLTSSAKKLSPRNSSIAFKNKVLKKKRESYNLYETTPPLPRKIITLGLIENNKKITLLIQDDPNGSEEIPTEEKARFCISFPKVISYRQSTESYRLKMLATMDPSLLASTGYGLFTVENSKFFKWLDKESYNRFEKRVPTHYLLITHHEVYDILSYQPPEVTELEPDTLSQQDHTQQNHTMEQGFSIWDLV